MTKVLTPRGEGYVILGCLILGGVIGSMMDRQITRSKELRKQRVNSCSACHNRTMANTVLQTRSPRLLAAAAAIRKIIDKKVVLQEVEECE